MILIFLDASVLFSAAYSSNGASHHFIQLGLAGEIELVVSDLVLEEARRNLADKAPEALPAFESFVTSAPWLIVEATRSRVVELSQHTALKDAPVVAAAERARVDWLVSLDTKHLVGNKALARAAEVRIALPGYALGHVREELAEERVAA